MLANDTSEKFSVDKFLIDMGNTPIKQRFLSYPPRRSTGIMLGYVTLFSSSRIEYKDPQV